MNAKKLFKLTGICATGASLVIGIRNFLRLREKYLVKAETKKSNEALQEFLELNDLYKGKDIVYVSDSGYTPIYTYNTKTFKPKKALIPKGYILHKLHHTSGVTNYAYGQERDKYSLFPKYHILFYLENEKDWHEGIFGKEIPDDFDDSADFSEI